MDSVKMYSNIDTDSVCTPFLNRIAEEGDFREEKLYPLVDLYKDTFVTDVLFCIFSQYSAVDSKYWTTYADKYLQTEYKGEKVDFKEEFKGIYKLNKEYGVDPYAVWIKRCWEIGKRPWLSVRMNDCHKNEFQKSAFYVAAEENGWFIGEEYGYYNDCFSYKVPQVRERMLSYIEEQLMKYDVYGIELDFMREIYCFDYLHDDMAECTELMNDFVRKVKGIAKRAEKKHGHALKIAVRLTRDIDQSLVFGFDARTWVKEKLVDVVIPSPRWASCDSGIPIDVWKKELSGAEIPGCMETLISGVFSGLAFMTAETARGLAANLLSAGADGIYLYNYFGEETVLERDREVHRTCGAVEEIYKHRTRCVIMGQDWDTCPKGMSPWSPLPIKLNAGEKDRLTFRTGKIPEGKKMKLIFGFTEGSIYDAEVTVNEKACKAFAAWEMEKPKNCVPEGTVCYAAEAEISSDKEQWAEIVALGDVNIIWAELVIE